MSDITFDSLSVVAVTAFLAPLVVDRIRRCGCRWP